MSDNVMEIMVRAKGSPSGAEGRYKELSANRSGFLTRGQEYSRFTLPYILPATEDSNRGDAGNQHGFQSIGAQCVNHLSNKITINMFPPGRSFFKLEFDQLAAEKLVAGGYDPTSLSEILVEAEKRAQSYQDKVAARVAYTSTIKNLLISGNICLFLPANGALQAIPINRYVVSRDLSSNLGELIVLQKKEFSMLSQEAKDLIKSIKGYQCPKDSDNISIYTWVKRKDENTFMVTQSACDVVIRGVQEISEKNCPYKPLMWNSAYGEDYGRGLVEDHAGDFYVIEFLSEAIVKGMVLMADIKYFLKPGSSTDIDEASSAPTGEWISGNIEDVGVLQLQKYADFTPISVVLDEYKKRVGQAFLLNSAVRRDAERVTALELRLDAQELETSLGGAYSLLAQTMQVSLAVLYLNRVSFPSNLVVPNIVTGLDAFGKAGDLDKIKQYTEMMQLPATWPVEIQRRTKFSVYSREVAAALSMKVPWQMTEEEWQKSLAEQAAQQQNQAIQEAGIKAAPNMVKAAQEGGMLNG